MLFRKYYTQFIYIYKQVIAVAAVTSKSLKSNEPQTVYTSIEFRKSCAENFPQI